MKPLQHSLLAAACLAAVLITPQTFAQGEPSKPIEPAVKQAHDRLPEDQPKGTSASATSSPAATAATTTSSSATTIASGQPTEAEMMQMMMEMSKLNDNHKLVATMAGTWDYTVKFWMAPGAPPNESKGTATRKTIMDGRYLTGDYSGKMSMPGADGKMHDLDFKGMSLDGYDNGKKKFISSWCDNMGTGIMLSEGTYDAISKTFTYNSEMEMMPGMKTQVREAVKLVDNDHEVFEYFETQAGHETKTMEIACTRKK